MMNTKAIGDKGETIAFNYLTNAGYVILERNYRCRMGEIDIIARFGDVLAFIEVKTRRTDRFGRPAMAVDYRKQQKIVKTSRFYLQYKGLEGCHCRFDVLEVLGSIGGAWSINHIKNAFEAG